MKWRGRGENDSTLPPPPPCFRPPLVSFYTFFPHPMWNQFDMGIYFYGLLFFPVPEIPLDPLFLHHTHSQVVLFIDSMRFLEKSHPSFFPPFSPPFPASFFSGVFFFLSFPFPDVNRITRRTVRFYKIMVQ